MLSQDTINKITTWGASHVNGNGTATDYDNKQFGGVFTEELRRAMRSMAIDGEPVEGSWRKGYKVRLPDGSAIGVGTYRRGYNGFAVIYWPPIINRKEGL